MKKKSGLEQNTPKPRGIRDNEGNLRAAREDTGIFREAAVNASDLPAATMKIRRWSNTLIGGKEESCQP